MKPIRVSISLHDPLLLTGSRWLRLREAGIPVNDDGEVPHGSLHVVHDPLKAADVYFWNPGVAPAPLALVPSPDVPPEDVEPCATLTLHGEYSSLKDMVEKVLADNPQANRGIIIVFTKGGNKGNMDLNWYCSATQLASSSVRLAKLANDMIDDVI